MNFEERFQHAAALHFRNWGRVNTFLQVAHLGMPHAQVGLMEETEAYVRMVEADDLEHQVDWVDYIKRVGSDVYAADRVSDAQSAVDAAALIFMHAVVDDTAMTCCELIAIAKPQDWEYWLHEKQVTLNNVKKDGYDSLFREALKKRFKKLEYESLLVKADMILRICSPPDGCKTNLEGTNLEGYVYDRDKLVLLDERRHGVVHGGSWQGVFRRNDEDLEYLFKTGVYFLDLVSIKYNPKDRRRTPDNKQ